MTASPITIGLARGAVKFCFARRTGKLIGGRNGRSWNIWPPFLRFRGKNKQKEETQADLIEGLKEEVKANQEAERELVDGDSLFGQEWRGEEGRTRFYH
jgi:hypothetical protein